MWQCFWGATLSGRELYERFLEGRQLRSAQARQQLVSRDPSGEEQHSEFIVRFKSYRDDPTEVARAKPVLERRSRVLVTALNKKPAP